MSKPAETGEMELFRALGALCETPRPEMQAVADLIELGPLPSRAAHGELFLFQLYPYASVYLGAEGMMGGEAADRIAGFWRALGQTPPEAPDHLALMLSLYARLGELEQRAAAGPERERWRHARRAFLWEHLLCWLPVLLMKLDAFGAGAGAGDPGRPGVAHPFYLRWGALLGAALRAEAAAMFPPAEGWPAALPLHLREAPVGVDPRRGNTRDFLASLLSPVRSGMVLVRADLARAARELGLGLRLGERRLVLAAMLEQDAGPALAWLAAEAAAWAARHRPEAHLAAPLATFWQDRAAATASLLRELHAEV